ncbi:MAG TPA: BatD family protein [Crocinitomicaceae bacterium]|jgi:hypothetical protein|nr:BatD family protein [Crocinitomicaceae bacterium]
MRVTLLFLLFYWSVTFVSAQKPMLKLSADKTILEEGFPISIKFETNKLGQFQFNLPASFQKTTQSNGANQSSARGARQVTYYFTQHGFFKTAGTYKINAVFYINGEKYKSNKIRVKVVKKTPSQRKDPTKEYA